MTKKYIHLIACSLAFFTAIYSCKKESNGDSTPPKQVENVVVNPDFGGFTLNWTNPSDSDFYYVDISYLDSNGKMVSKKASKYTNKAIIDGLTEAKEYTLTLTSYDLSGNSSTPLIVKSTCKTPPFKMVADQLAVNPDFGGINVKWQNTTGKVVSVVIAYQDNAGAKQKQTATSKLPSDVAYVSGLTSVSKTFTITVTDSLGNPGPAKTYTITPLAESKIAKSSWSVVSFDSEEASGEGPNNGKVIFAIDDNINTFWHTQWMGGTPGYPHWFIINMNQTVTISRFELFRRQNNNTGMDKVKFLVSMDGTTWTDLGEFSFNRNTNDGQSYRIPSNPQARYFKFVATSGPNAYTHLGEINVYGSVN